MIRLGQILSIPIYYREFFKDNLKVTCTVDDITTVRNYKRVP